MVDADTGEDAQVASLEQGGDVSTVGHDAAVGFAACNRPHHHPG